jgi:tRNA (cytidine/uridine-2'-O-)-methyltransferase
VINLVLVEPEIPSNTGNIARTCAATRSRLHLVKPLGFDISDKAVKRAGLDYWSMVDITVYENIEEFLEKHGEDDLWLTTTKAPKIYTEAKLNDGCYILFGKETAGLPLWLRERYRDRCVRLPMREDARSLNLSNTAAVMCYEALRQQGFPNLKELGEMASNFN